MGVDYDFHSIYAYESGEIYEVIPETRGEYTGLTDKFNEVVKWIIPEYQRN